MRQYSPLSTVQHDPTSLYPQCSTSHDCMQLTLSQQQCALWSIHILTQTRIATSSKDFTQARQAASRWCQPIQCSSSNDMTTALAR